MNKVEKQIQKYLNQEYQYGMKILRIVGYDIDEVRGRMYIHTDEKESHFDRPLDEVHGLLLQLQPVTNMNVVKASQADVLIATAANADKLKAILMDNIEKVQKDASYIKQATTINNNVNSYQYHQDAARLCEGSITDEIGYLTNTHNLITNAINTDNQRRTY